MSVRKVQLGFSGGELSPAMYGRFDDSKFEQGLAKCRNFIALPQGPAVVRPGTAYVNATKYPEKRCRLIPFTFSSDQTMVLEVGDKYIRFHTDGKTLLKSDGTPYEISTPYAADDVFDIHYAQSMDVLTLVHPNYPARELKRYSAYDWRLETINFVASLQPPPSAPAVEYKVVAGKDVTITDEEKTRYDLKYCITSVRETDTGEEESSASAVGWAKGNLYLSNATCTLSWQPVSGASRYRVYKNYQGLYCFIGETEENTFVDDNYEPDAGITPPRYDDPFYQGRGVSKATVVNGGSGYRGWTGAVGGVAPGTNVSYSLVNSSSQRYEYPTVDYPAVSEFRAKVVDLAGNGSGAEVELAVTHSIQQYQRRHTTGSGDNRDYYYTYHTEATTTVTAIKVTSPGSGYVRPALQLWAIYVPGPWLANYNKTYTIPLELEEYGAACAVTDSTGSGADIRLEVSGGRVVAAYVRSGGQNYTSPTATVTAKYGSGAEVKLEVGSSADSPGTVCYYEQRRCFAGTPTRPQMVWMTRSGTESNMSYTLPAQDDNRLRFRVAAQEASRIRHLVPLSQLIALTDTTEYRLSSGGSQPMAPDSIDSKVQAHIGASNVQPVKVNSSIVYAAARGGHVYELGYNWQSSGYTTGDLSVRAAHIFENRRAVDMALAKAPDPVIWICLSDGTLAGLTYLPEQAIGAWHLHSTTNGFIESVTTVPETEEDAVYLVVRRAINGRVARYVERMHERYFSKLEDAWCVDCGGVYLGNPTTEVGGLTWLEGQTVSILADGCVLPQRVVKDGKVTLTQPSRHVIVGLPITADMQTLPATLQLPDGSYGTGHMKNVAEIFLRVINSSGVFVGPSFDDLTERKQRRAEPYGSPPALMDGEISVVPDGAWSASGQICVRQADPLPLTVVSVSYDFAS